MLVCVPDMEKIKQARRFIRGAAMLLADASNGDRVIEQIACEASTLAIVTEIVIHERSQEEKDRS